MTRILDVSPTPDNTTISAANGFQQSEIGRMLALGCSRNGQVVYAGSFANLWVSQDGSQTWNQVTWPQPQPSQFGVPGSLGAEPELLTVDLELDTVGAVRRSLPVLANRRI